MVFIGKISKGHNSVKIVDGVMVLILYALSDGVYICTKFHENIPDRIKVIKRTRFSYKKNQRGIIP